MLHLTVTWGRSAMLESEKLRQFSQRRCLSGFDRQLKIGNITFDVGQKVTIKGSYPKNLIFTQTTLGVSDKRAGHPRSSAVITWSSPGRSSGHPVITWSSPGRSSFYLVIPRKVIFSFGHPQEGHPVIRSSLGHPQEVIRSSLESESNFAQFNKILEFCWVFRSFGAYSHSKRCVFI